MKKLSIITTVFFVFDIVIINFLPIDFSYQTINYIPSFSLIIFLLNSESIKINDQILLILIIGLFQDIFAMNFSLINMFTNLFILFLYKFWSKNVSGTTLENTTLLLLIIFVKDLMTLLFFNIVNITNLNLTSFIINNALITFCINIVLLPLIINFSKNYLYK